MKPRVLPAERMLRLLGRLHDLVARAESADDALSTCLDTCLELFGWDVGVVHPVGEGESIAGRRLGAQLGHDHAAALRLAMLGEREPGGALPPRFEGLQEARVIWRKGSSKPLPFSPLAERMGFSWLLAVPVRGGGSLMGVFELTAARAEPDPIELQVVTQVADLTGQLLAKLRLEHESERQRRQLETFLNRTPTALAMLDPAGVIAWANPALGALMGCSSSSLVGTAVDAMLTAPGALDPLLNEIAPEAASVMRRPLVLRTDEGECEVVADAHGIWTRDKLENVLLFFVETRAAAAVDRERARFRVLADHASDALLLVGQDGRVRYANLSAQRMAGTDGSLRDSPIRRWLPELNQDSLHQAAHSEPEQEPEPARPGEFRTATGESFAVDITVTREPHVQQPALSIVVRDIRERIAQEERLADQARQLEERDQRKDEFLAMLAHELRNPLAAVSNAVQLLAGGKAPLGSREERAVQLIGRQTRHLARLVSDLLDMARLDQARFELQREPLSAQTILDASVDLARPWMQQEGHRFTVEANGASELWIDGDRERLVQVLGNLLRNAAKYTPSGGHVALRVSATDLDLRIEVEDDGEGLPQSLLRQLFDPFAQADRTLDRSQGGMGLGLSVAKGIVQLHGGRIAAFSAGLGEGATFTVTLPRVAKPGRAAPLSPSEQAEAIEEGRPLRVLVVDDQADARESLADWLEDLGHDVTSCEDGAAALRVAESKRFDLGLLDIGLPEMDGFELARRLGAVAERRPRWLVAVTGYGESSDRAASQAAGFDQHVVKPLDPEQLRTAIAHARE